MGERKQNTTNNKQDKNKQTKKQTSTFEFLSQYHNSSLAKTGKVQVKVLVFINIFLCNMSCRS